MCRLLAVIHRSYRIHPHEKQFILLYRYILTPALRCVYAQSMEIQSGMHTVIHSTQVQLMEIEDTVPDCRAYQACDMHCHHHYTGKPSLQI
ncbi:MAG: hypothetical protein KF888_01145 [Nitrosomonas sp.]|nr:hypothetical protein [Nitrosomonas sp.]